MQEGRLGQGGQIQLKEPLDTWNPQVVGSSARVFLGEVQPLEGIASRVAIKVMRPDEKRYAAPLFREEVRILYLLKDVPGVMRMKEMGFVYLDAPHQMPPDTDNKGGERLSGRLYRYTPDETEQFLRDFDNHVRKGGLPYIGARRVYSEDNLWKHCDRFVNRGYLLPLADGLRIAYHALGILEAAHQRGVIYRDHKIVHYYWHYDAKWMAVPVTIIDWNAGKYYPDGLSEDERRWDVVLFAVNTLYYMLAGERHPRGFTVGPLRIEEIAGAGERFRMEWNGHRPLPKSVIELLEKALNGEYRTAAALQQEIGTLLEALQASA